MESNIASVVLFHLTDDNGNSIPLRIEVNSWVTLQPGEKGGHAQDARRHGGASLSGAYKAKILKFKAGRSATTVSQILVQHAYMRRQLHLNPHTPTELESACNYLYPSKHEDWIHPSSITGVICITHANIGEATKDDRTHRQLLEDSIFFYNAWYHPSESGGYGCLEPIPLPKFDHPSWPLPDMATTESFRARLRSDFVTCMKHTTRSRSTHISWFMPIGFMVDLFSIASNIHRTRTTWVFKNISTKLFHSLMDNDWDTKIVLGVDEFKCIVDRESVCFKYHIKRSTLYTNFQFYRMRLIDGEWKDIDQRQSVQPVKVNCEMGDWHKQLEVGHNWTLSALRSEVQMALGANAPEDFSFWIIHGGFIPNEKVNCRNERNKTASTVLPPKLLRIVAKLN